MSGFQHLSVDGFRRLCGLEIDFTDRPLCVAIGANGSGKTSLLDAFSLLAATAESRQGERIGDLSGLLAILTDEGRTEPLRLGVSVADPDRGDNLNYELALLPRGHSYIVHSESLARVAVFK